MTCASPYVQNSKQCRALQQRGDPKQPGDCKQCGDRKQHVGIASNRLRVLFKDGYALLPDLLLLQGLETVQSDAAAWKAQAADIGPVHTWRCTAADLQGLETVQSDAAAWKAQAQDNLHQVNQLKTLLEESAFWGANGEAFSAGQQQTEQTEIPQGDDIMLLVCVPKVGACHVFVFQLFTLSL